MIIVITYCCESHIRSIDMLSKISELSSEYRQSYKTENSFVSFIKKGFTSGWLSVIGLNVH